MHHEEIVYSVRAELQRTRAFYLSGRRICFSSPETREDALLIVESLSVWSGMLLDFSDFSPVFMTGSAAQRGRLRSLIKPAVLDFAKADIALSMHFLDTITHLVVLEMSVYPGTFKGYRNLKKVVDKVCESSNAPTSLKALVKFLLTSLDLEGCCEEGDHASAFRYFLTCTRFLKKLPLNRKDLEASMEDEYMEDERRLGGMEARLTSEENLWWVYSLNALAREVFADFAIQSFNPKHGPGRVATDGVTSVLDKYLDMKDDARINYLLRKHNFGTLSDYTAFDLTARSSRTAKFICVPKTWKTLRGISAEPTELQFSQQAVLDSLDDFFRMSPFFKQRLNLHSQEENQRLAKLGSLDQSLATIDLSKASDSVSLSLVKRVFRGTKLLPWLLATRSTSVELKNYGVIKTNKFAPMGSSTCFPVECIIFAMIAEVARRACITSKGMNFIPIPRVYGDDIVCASVTVPLVLNGLDQLGFLPNREKSYWSGFFRESCGKEYWYGQDISPIYYRVEGGNLVSHVTSYDGITSVISLYNSLYLNGYNTARRTVLSSLKQKKVVIGGKQFPYFNLCARSFDGSNGTIVSSWPTNFNLHNYKMKLELNGSGENYQVLRYQTVTWKCVYVRLEKVIPSKDIQQAVLLAHLWDRVNYCEWFIQARRLDPDRPKKDAIGVNPSARLPIGYEMVPRLRGVDVNRYFTIS